MSSGDDDEEGSSGDNEKEALKKLDLKVKEIMSPNPLTIPADATVMQAAKAMDKHDSSCVFVKSKGKIVGIITERDITRRVVGKGASPKQTKVKSVMTSRIVVTSPEASIEEALKVMTTNKLRRLPVVDKKGDMVGLVSTADIAKALAEKAGYSTSLIAAMTKETPPPSGVYG
jgi:CBS domain-containing protein